MDQTYSTGEQSLPLARSSTRNLYVILVVLASVFYNGILAAVNAHMMPLAFGHVAMVEISILLCGIAYIFVRGVFSDDMVVLIFLMFNLVLAIYLSAVNKTVFVDFFRNMLIICCFTLLGMRINQATVMMAFRIACLCVLVVLVIEVVSTKSYENIFYPAKYFENTRGLTQIAFGGSKLFQNAIKIPGRFSFGIADHRTASIFMEQVSLANFSGVLLIYITTLFKKLSRFDLALCIFTIMLILVTNDSRSMLIFAFICFAGYWLFPKMDSRMAIVIMPIIILAGLVVYYLRPDASGDTLDGRVVLTVTKLLDTDFMGLLGLDVAKVGQFADSGYVYIINADTIFGLIGFWLFVTFFPAGETADQRRCAYSLSVFLFMNMMIGGTAVFSIKVAGLMWLLVGFMKASGTGQILSRPVRIQ